MPGSVAAKEPKLQKKTALAHARQGSVAGTDAKRTPAVIAEPIR